MKKTDTRYIKYIERPDDDYEDTVEYLVNEELPRDYKYSKGHCKIKYNQEVNRSFNNHIVFLEQVIEGLKWLKKEQEQ